MSTETTNFVQDLSKIKNSMANTIVIMHIPFTNWKFLCRNIV